MSNRDKIIILAVLAVILFGASIILFITYSNCEERCKLQGQEIESLRTEVVSQSQEVESLQEEVANQEQSITSLQGKVTDQQQIIEYLEEKLAGALPYAKADASPIILQNNYGNVHNPTWAELVSFLESDNTESIWYDYASFVCGDFAERVHNNAEKAGIRAGIAIIYFAGELFPHALNVFYTTDYGLVYIDCTASEPVYTYSIYTGVTTTSTIGEDKVAYVGRGKECGLIPLGVMETSFGICFHYPCYEGYVESWEAYNTAVVSYNAEVDVYNATLGGRIFLEEPDYSYFSDWYDRLEAWSRNLDRQGTQFGDYWYESLGIVESIEIYWNAIEWAVNEN